MGMLEGTTRDLSPDERQLFDLLLKQGYSQNDIAGMLSSMGGTNYARGTSYLVGEEPKSAALESMLNEIMSGNKSFIDSGYAGTLYNQARANAAREFSQAGDNVATQMSKRGLFGGGQHAGALRAIESDKAAALAQQGTQIYADQAQRQAAERASALDALLQKTVQNQQLGTNLMTQGAANLGQASNSLQGVGANWSNTLGNFVQRPQQAGWLSQLFGGIQAGGSVIDQILGWLKKWNPPSTNPTGGGMQPLTPETVNASSTAQASAGASVAQPQRQRIPQWGA